MKEKKHNEWKRHYAVAWRPLRNMFGWHILAYLGLSWLISSHKILFILPVEHYSFYQPNTLSNSRIPHETPAADSVSTTLSAHGYYKVRIFLVPPNPTYYYYYNATQNNFDFSKAKKSVRKKASIGNRLEHHIISRPTQDN
jgi:hypothetical protein